MSRTEEVLVGNDKEDNSRFRLSSSVLLIHYQGKYQMIISNKKKTSRLCGAVVEWTECSVWNTRGPRFEPSQ